MKKIGVFLKTDELEVDGPEFKRDRFEVLSKFFAFLAVIVTNHLGLNEKDGLFLLFLFQEKVLLSVEFSDTVSFNLFLYSLSTLSPLFHHSETALNTLYCLDCVFI